MSGSGADKRAEALAKRVAKLRSEGVSVRETAEIVCVHKGRIRTLQLLGERLMTLKDGA
ncbi:hypothetical protein PF66_06233 [Pseudomonas asplenii]|uniref:Uncharacterized protein n=1 Tax=Pseudomonas asplenii TaxID=53407 RepID=A0A0N0E166_9PSED|nr:hypothetical protein [Pseudomonas fuscovaginae]KPA87323.1 hypothetical protein PF66_06233 [Pseudomonas fuscovaginae]